MHSRPQRFTHLAPTNTTSLAKQTLSACFQTNGPTSSFISLQGWVESVPTAKIRARFFYENAVMGILLMEHARRNGTSKFVQVGTVCSYPKFTPVPFREDDLWDGYPEETNAAYGIAKRRSWFRHRRTVLNTVSMPFTFFPANLYGPWDNFDLGSSHVIPALIRKCIGGQVGGRAQRCGLGDRQSDA